MGLGRVATEDLQGDAAAGRALFFGNGRCTRCHIVAGQGNGFGPELTEIGARRGAANLRASITDPSGEMPLGIGVFRSRGFASHLTVQVSPAGGDPVLGIRLNEDTFTIQVMDRRGGIHSFRKGEADLDKQFDRSLMPTRDLSASQVEDLVAYLATLRGATPKAVSD